MTTWLEMKREHLKDVILKSEPIIDRTKISYSRDDKYKILTVPHEAEMAGGNPACVTHVVRCADRRVLWTFFSERIDQPIEIENGVLFTSLNDIGMTVCNLRNGAVQDHVPDTAKNGVGFEWRDIVVAPDMNHIAVLGIDRESDANSLELRVYNLSDFPLPHVATFQKPVDEFLFHSPNRITIIQYDETLDADLMKCIEWDYLNDMIVNEDVVDISKLDELLKEDEN